MLPQTPVAGSRPHLWRNLCRRFDCCSDLDKRTDEPLGPPPPNEIPTSPILGILVGLANATNSRFFTNCYSDSAWITPSAGHTQPRAPENPDGTKIQQDFKMLKGNALQHDPEKWEPVFGKDHAPALEVHLAAQKRRNIELVVLGLGMLRSSTTAPVPLRHTPLCELRC